MALFSLKMAEVKIYHLRISLFSLKMAALKMHYLRLNLELILKRKPYEMLNEDEGKGEAI